MSTQNKKTRGTKKTNLDSSQQLLAAAPEEKLLEAHKQSLLAAHEAVPKAKPKGGAKTAAKVAAGAAAAATAAAQASAKPKVAPATTPKQPTASMPVADVVEDQPLEEYINEKRSGIRKEVLAAIVIGAIILIGLACCLGYYNDRSGEPYYTNSAYITDRVAPSQAHAQGVALVPVIVDKDGSTHFSTGNGVLSHYDLAKAVASTVSGKGETVVPVVVYLFNFDSDGVPESPTLSKMAKAAKDTGKTIYVKAYTDDHGNAAYNQKLSQRRADAIKEYMQQHGVPADHVKASGYGPTHKYPSDLQNRRAELTLK